MTSANGTMLAEEDYDDYNATLTDANATISRNISSSAQQQHPAMEESVRWRYTIFVPVLIALCALTFLMNFAVAAAFPFIRHLSKVTRPYVTFILSLVISDAFASFLLGFSLLFGSYLPVVQNVHLVGVCVMLFFELMKLVGIVITVLHLLTMVAMHLAGVMNPVRFKEYFTHTASRGLVTFLWLLPTLILLAPFTLIPEQGFRSEGCQKFDFLTQLSFRASYCAAIIAPTVGIIALYTAFHALLWCGRDISKSSISRQNVRAARVTFLIMLTCVAGWLPAVAVHLLICSSGCVWTPQDLTPGQLFTIHAVSYGLIIFKSFCNPLIFALRQANIREAMGYLVHRLLLCKPKEDAERIFRAHTITRYSSITRTSTNRGHRNNSVMAANGHHHHGLRESLILSDANAIINANDNKRKRSRRKSSTFLAIINNNKGCSPRRNSLVVGNGVTVIAQERSVGENDIIREEED